MSDTKVDVSQSSEAYIDAAERRRVLASLVQMRKKMLLSQDWMAGAMGVTQPTISQFESSDDVKLSTLQRYARALRGVLVVSVRYDDWEPGGEV